MFTPHGKKVVDTVLDGRMGVKNAVYQAAAEAQTLLDTIR